MKSFLLGFSVGVNVLQAIMISLFVYVYHKDMGDASAIGFDVNAKTDETVILGFR